MIFRSKKAANKPNPDHEFELVLAIISTLLTDVHLKEIFGKLDSALSGLKKATIETIRDPKKSALKKLHDIIMLFNATTLVNKKEVTSPTLTVSTILGRENFLESFDFSPKYEIPELIRQATDKKYQHVLVYLIILILSRFYQKLKLDKGLLSYKGNRADLLKYVKECVSNLKYLKVSPKKIEIICQTMPEANFVAFPKINKVKEATPQEENDEEQETKPQEDKNQAKPEQETKLQKDKNETKLEQKTKPQENIDETNPEEQKKLANQILLFNIKLTNIKTSLKTYKRINAELTATLDRYFNILEAIHKNEELKMYRIEDATNESRKKMAQAKIIILHSEAIIKKLNIFLKMQQANPDKDISEIRTIVSSGLTAQKDNSPAEGETQPVADKAMGGTQQIEANEKQIRRLVSQFTLDVDNIQSCIIDQMDLPHSHLKGQVTVRDFVTIYQDILHNLEHKLTKIKKFKKLHAELKVHDTELTLASQIMKDLKCYLLYVETMPTNENAWQHERRIQTGMIPDASTVIQQGQTLTAGTKIPAGSYVDGFFRVSSDLLYPADSIIAKEITLPANLEITSNLILPSRTGVGGLENLLHCVKKLEDTMHNIKHKLKQTRKKLSFFEEEPEDSDIKKLKPAREFKATNPRKKS